MAKYKKGLLERLYREMLRIRAFEESLVQPIIKKEIKCPVHLYTGQEAVAVGVCLALSKKDYVFSNHRSHGHYLAKGGSMEELAAEIYGKEDGCSKGRGGSMHVISKEQGFLGSVPIVGGTISLALGAALANRIRKNRGVAVSFFGDGATGEGVLFESLNFAALKKLPIIFVCENNLYSTHLPIKEYRPKEPIFKIAESFGISNYQIDGNDILKVFQVAKRAVDLCRAGKGPVFIECLTYRTRGHVGPDDNIQGNRVDIRPKSEIEKWRKKDPIRRIENYLQNNKVMKRENLEEIKKEIEAEVVKANAFAKQKSYSDPKELDLYVFE